VNVDVARGVATVTVVAVIPKQEQALEYWAAFIQALA
jgi:hypothetical protein